MGRGVPHFDDDADIGAFAGVGLEARVVPQRQQRVHRIGVAGAVGVSPGALITCWRRERDPGGDVTRVEGAVAELTGLVSTPAPDAAIFADSAGVVVTARAMWMTSPRPVTSTGSLRLVLVPSPAGRSRCCPGGRPVAGW